MLVGERMKRPVITIKSEMPIVEALEMMHKEHIRRAPVVKDGKLIGIVSEKDLLNASPSSATSLSIWEMNYLLSKIQVKDIMTKNVLTVAEDTTLEEAARIMSDNKIGCLPVLRDEAIVGIITETDLFKIFLELLGAREMGVRVTALIRDERGQLAKLTHALTSQGGDFVAFGLFSGEDSSNRLLTFKVAGVEMEKVKDLLEPIVIRIVDIRSTR
jgi:acetoin utilization protein AcuB